MLLFGKLVATFWLVALVVGQEDLRPCGDAFYSPAKYTCYDSDFLCPVLAGTPTLRCGGDCYLPSMYSCAGNHLVYPPKAVTASSETSCASAATTLHLSSPPYENYFSSDCHSSAQVVVTSPLPGSNLTVISPRIIVAWPAGNSGVVTYFAPENGINGSLGINLLNVTSDFPLQPIYRPGENATNGISMQLQLNSSAVLPVAILGSIRTVRDFTEGPSLLRSQIQSALQFSQIDNGVEISRLWLDNITTTTISFTSIDSVVQIDNTTLIFEAGTYTYNASFNYPQLEQISSTSVLNPDSQALITQSPEQTESLSFLSYTTKLTAGAWRFLTYFGRDSMIAALLLQPVLSQGDGGAIEAVIAAVLERINSTDGSVCHEETIGDYATWLNLQENITSTAPSCDYKMIDSDYYLPILMERYFLQSTTGSSRSESFLSTAASFFPSNSNLTYLDLAKINANKIITLAQPFTAPGNQTIDNLIHLKDGQIVGEWRDSTYGIGGGRIPLDVNSALVPAALNSIAALSTAGILSYNASMISGYAKIWEDFTLPFFEITLPQATAQDRVTRYAALAPKYNSQLTSLPAQASSIEGNVTFYALALEGNNNLSQVAVMNTDTCFRLFMLNTTNEAQLTSFLNTTADSIRRRFPAGLMTDVGMLIANPAFGEPEIYAANWTTSAYHGTVVWSWQLAMMASGLQAQLGRCIPATNGLVTPEFCGTASVFENVKHAYNVLWDSIEANREHLSTEVWSWIYTADTDAFVFEDLGALPPPPGQSPTESDVVQLWSLAFLAVGRDARFQ
ncbi:glycogen debranching enzyme [Coleophoma crateriformis]|uniref:Glycogen debranching enzyme n=1 Tax=Coleophoma crateriformis TaxID=565419 RepID=A0A3D8S3T3_9HELO|nr:glycogen debranching enzyme [Coleophoma crateriformis]